MIQTDLDSASGFACSIARLLEYNLVMPWPKFFLFTLVSYAMVPAAFASELEVLSIDFDLVDQPGTNQSWYEIAVKLSVKKGEPADEGNPRFADEVGVALSFATESSRRDGSSYGFYSARAEYPTLEVGQHVVRFYLAPELVKRDRIKGEPFAFEVRVESGGELATSLLSRNLSQGGALETYRSKMAAGDSGDLRLAFDTPFAWSYPRDTPNARVRTDGS